MIPANEDFSGADQSYASWILNQRLFRRPNFRNFSDFGNCMTSDSMPYGLSGESLKANQRDWADVTAFATVKESFGITYIGLRNSKIGLGKYRFNLGGIHYNGSKVMEIKRKFELKLLKSTKPLVTKNRVQMPCRVCYMRAAAKIAICPLCLRVSYFSRTNFLSSAFNGCVQFLSSKAVNRYNTLRNQVTWLTNIPSIKQKTWTSRDIKFSSTSTWRLPK